MAVISAKTSNGISVGTLASLTYASSNVLGMTVDIASYDPTNFVWKDTTLAVEASHYVDTLLPKFNATTRVSQGVNTPYYERFVQVDNEYIVPDTFAITLADVNADTYVTRGVMNGWRTDEEILSFSYSSSAGVSVNTPAVGHVFNRHTETAFQILVTGNHITAVFNVTITITTTNHTYYLYVRGNRRLEPGTFLSVANWNEPIGIENKWWTSVFQGTDTSETRKMLRPIPQRVLNYVSLFSGIVQVQQAWALVHGMVRQRRYFPVVPDVTRVEEETTSSTILCDTTLRNFQVGYYIVAIHAGFDNSIGYAFDNDTTQLIPMLVTAITDTSITVSGGVPETLEKGDYIYPAILAEVAIKPLTMKLFSDKKGTLDFNISEVVGSTMLPNANSDYSPTLYHDRADLELEHNWTERPSVGFARPASVSDSGRYQVMDYYHDGSRATMSVLVSAMSREAVWELRGKLSYMQGRYNYFWVTSPLDLIDVGPTQSTSKIEIISSANLGNLESMFGIYIENAAGDKDFLSGAVVNNAGALEFEYDDTTSVLSVTIVKQAYLMRLGKDSVSEVWHSPEVLEVKLNMIEVLGAYG